MVVKALVLIILSKTKILYVIILACFNFVNEDPGDGVDIFWFSLLRWNDNRQGELQVGDPLFIELFLCGFLMPISVLLSLQLENVQQVDKVIETQLHQCLNGFALLLNDFNRSKLRRALWLGVIARIYFWSTGLLLWKTKKMVSQRQLFLRVIYIAIDGESVGRFEEIILCYWFSWLIKLGCCLVWDVLLLIKDISWTFCLMLD